MEAILDRHSHDDLICGKCGSENILLTLSGKYWYCGDCNSIKIKTKEESANE